MVWQPATFYNLKLETPVQINRLVMTGPQLGQLQDSGLGITGTTTLGAGVTSFLPPVGNPHVANHVYIDPATGLWLVSTG